MEQDLRQRQETVQAIEPDAATPDGDQPMEPAEDSPTLVVSSHAVLRLAQVTRSLSQTSDPAGCASY